MHVLIIGGRDGFLDEVSLALRQIGFVAMAALGREPALLLEDVTGVDLVLIFGYETLTDPIAEVLRNRRIPTVVVAPSSARHSLARLRSESVLLPEDASTSEIASACSIVTGRRIRLDEPVSIESGPVTLDLELEFAYIGGRPIELPRKEFLLLKELILADGKPVSSDELLRRVWPDGSAVTPGDVHRHIYRLRSMIGDHGREDAFIVNRRGYGYAVSPAGQKGDHARSH